MTFRTIITLLTRTSRRRSFIKFRCATAFDTAYESKP